MNSHRAATEIEARLRAAGTPERAAWEKRYLKSDLEFLGANVWEIRRAARAFATENPELSHHDLIAIVDALWSKPVHDRRMAAVMLLEARASRLGPDDLAGVERLVRDSRTWALVDGLAADVAGGIVVRHPAAASRLDRWAGDGDFWVRRSAMLALLKPHRQGAPLDRFLGYADAMFEETEFFIRKAIGWVLRDAAKQRPDEVAAWLAPRTARASGVTMREAVKYLAPAQRDELMRAYKEKRAARISGGEEGG